MLLRAAVRPDAIHPHAPSRPDAQAKLYYVKSELSELENPQNIEQTILNVILKSLHCLVSTPSIFNSVPSAGVDQNMLRIRNTGTFRRGSQTLMP